MPTIRCNRSPGRIFCRRAMCLFLLWLPLLAPNGFAQVAPGDGPVTRGMYNWIHSTADAELAFTFYHQVFGFELARSTFAGAGNADTPPPPIRSRAQAGSDPLVWDLTNTHGSRFRTVFMESRHLPFGHELSEFFDIAREHRLANPWDTGNSSLVLHVRDFDDVVYRLRAFGAPVVTFGGVPVATAAGRSILVRDPDGYLVQVIEASREDRDAMRGGTVLRAAIRLTVADIDSSLAFYRDLLDFEVAGERDMSGDVMRVFGLGAGSASEIVTRIPGIGADVILTTFSFPGNARLPVHDYQWQLQDVGSPQFQLQVAGLDDLLVKTREAGYRFLSVGGRPIQRPFGRFVFAVDPDGVLVEFVEPGQP